jgi:hypothetical protein
MRVEASLANVIGSPSTTTWALPLLDLENSRGHKLSGATSEFVENGMEALKKVCT